MPRHYSTVEFATPAPINLANRWVHSSQRNLGLPVSTDHEYRQPVHGARSVGAGRCACPWCWWWMMGNMRWPCPNAW